MPVCGALTVGSAYSRKGTNQYRPCEHPAKYHVRKEYRRLTGETSVYEEDVCGVHVKGARADLARDGRLAEAYARMGSANTPSRTVTITPLPEAP
jgi:hypothetical protein